MGQTEAVKHEICTVVAHLILLPKSRLSIKQQDIIYIDDIIVFGDVFFKTLAIFELVLKRIKLSGLKLKLSTVQT